MRIKKHSLVTVIILVCLILTANSMISFAQSNVNPRNNGSDQATNLTISEKEMQDALNQSLLHKTKTLKLTPPYYEGIEASPEKHVLVPDLYKVAEELKIPHNSYIVKRDLLKQLTGKTLVKFYNNTQSGSGCKSCQVLVTCDPIKEDYYVYMINPGHEHKHTLSVLDQDGHKTPMLLKMFNQNTIEQLEHVDKKDIEQINTIRNQRAEILNRDETTGETVSKTSSYKINVIKQNNPDAHFQEVALMPADGVGFMKLEQRIEDKPSVKALASGASAVDESATLSGVKKAQKIAGADDVFEISMEFEGTRGTSTTVEPVATDVIAVVDLSNSMENTYEGIPLKDTRWQKLLPALDKMSNKLLDGKSNIRLAQVGFGEQRTSSIGAHYTYCNLTSTKDTFQNAYRKNSTTYKRLSEYRTSVMLSGTNCHAGFVGARELFATRTGEDENRKKYIIYLSDGYTTAYYLNDTNPYRECSSLNAPPTFYPADGVRRALEVADSLKTDTTIYTIGVDVGGSGRADDMLEKAATNKSHYNDNVSSSQLDSIYEKIANEIQEETKIHEHENVTLTDNMSEYVTFLPSHGGILPKAQYSDDGGKTWKTYTGAQPTYPSGSNQALSWTVKSFHSDYKYRVLYRVQLKDEYKGQKLHEDQTYGHNPGTTDKVGVIANRATYLTSDLIPIENRQDVKVPAVYADKPTAPFKFVKTGSASLPLPNAKFTLHECKNGHTHAATAPRAGCWQSAQENISGGNGLVDFGSLQEGTYMLVENSAPAGYETPYGQWKIAIDPSESLETNRVKITAVGEIPPPAFKRVDGALQLPNLPQHKLPDSGSLGIYPYIMVGISIVMLAGVMYLLNRRKTTK